MLPAIRFLLVATVEAQLADPERRGCMVVNAAMERPHDEETSARVVRSLAGIEAAFAGALRRAQASGEIAADRDPAAAARFLLTTLQGLRVVAKATPDRRRLHDTIEIRAGRRGLSFFRLHSETSIQEEDDHGSTCRAGRSGDRRDQRDRLRHGAALDAAARRAAEEGPIDIVINGSVNGLIGMAGMSVYSASKAAVRSLARTLSAELLPRRIRVNVVSPGPIETALYAKTGLPEGQVAAFAEHVKGQIPLGRFGSAGRGRSGGPLPRERRLVLRARRGADRGRRHGGPVSVTSSSAPSYRRP